jgi:hypothetical protein
VVSAFRSEVTAVPRAHSPQQIDYNMTAKVLFFIFRSTPADFINLYTGLENGGFLLYGRQGGHTAVTKPSLVFMKDENSTCNSKTMQNVPYNITSNCVITYENSTSHANGFVNGAPSKVAKYDPRVRPWYKSAKTDTTYGGTAWYGLYEFASDGAIGITAAAQIISSSGEFLGVTGYDFKLTELETILAGEYSSTAAVNDDAGEPMFIAFIVDTSGLLYATSVSGHAWKNGSEVPAVNCTYKTIAVAAKRFGARPEGYDTNRVLTFSDEKGRMNWARSRAFEDDHGLQAYMVLVQRISCPSNYYASNSSIGECLKCTSPYTSIGGDVSASCDLCTANFYMGKSACTACTDGMICENYGTSMNNLEVKSGWYRFSNLSEVVYQCKNFSEYPDACNGGKRTGQESCEEHTEGPLCRLCARGYFHNTDDYSGKCTECESSEIYTMGVLLMMVFAAFSVCLASAWNIARRLKQRGRSVLDRIKGRLNAWVDVEQRLETGIVTARIIYFNMQVITTFTHSKFPSTANP